MAIIEDDTWHVTLMSRFSDCPPHDEESFWAFTKALHTSKLYDLIKDAERVSDITHYRFPSSVHRHYEHLSSFPEGFLVLGDAIASFNPFYGQGMTSAALQAKALQQLLAERTARGQGMERLAQSFFSRAADVISTPWTMNAVQDLSYPQTRGKRPANLEESVQYFAGLDALTAEDVDIQRLLSEVLSLAKPLSALQEEPLKRKVMLFLQKQAVA